MDVEDIRDLYKRSRHMLKIELRNRRVIYRDNDCKAVLVELMITDMLRTRVASGARSPGAMSVD